MSRLITITKTKVQVKVVNLSATLSLPEYQTEGSAGFDLFACFDNRKDFEIRKWLTNGSDQKIWVHTDSQILLSPGERVLIPTNIAIELPEGFELQIRSRSGMALSSGVVVLNSPATIDSDYRGIIKVILINQGHNTFKIVHGDRIAQGIISQVYSAKFYEKESLTPTNRGEGGFGHTGK